MLKQKRQAVRNSDQNLKLWDEKLRMMLGSSTIYMLTTWSATLRQILETSIGTSIVRKMTIKIFSPLKEEEELVSQLQKLNRLRNFNGQFTDVFNKNDHTEVPFLSRSTPFMDDIVVSNEGVTKLLKGMNLSKALGPGELHPRVLKVLAT